MKEIPVTIWRDKKRSERWLSNQKLSLYSFEYILFDLGLAEFPDFLKNLNDFETISAYEMADFKKEHGI